MATASAMSPISRRAMMGGALGAGLSAPLALHFSALAQGQDQILDYSGHPAVGIWINQFWHEIPYAYSVIHADGTSTYYNRYTSEFRTTSDSQLPVFGFGLWRPVDDRSAEGVLYVAWGDTRVDTFMKFNHRGTASVDGTTMSGEVRERVYDSSGKLLSDGTFPTQSRRMEWEPFEEDASSAATPVR